jgi:multiple sugar transport system substrate-binding protein
VPSTVESLKDPELNADPHFSTFMKIFQNPKSTFKPITPIGQVDQDLFGSLAEKYQAGKVSNLQSELSKLDDQIAKQLQLG